MADAGCVARSLASRSVLKDKPTGVMKIPEALWVDFPGHLKSLWRIRFTVQNCELTNLKAEDWQMLRQRLLHAVRAAVRSILVPRLEEFKKKPKVLQIAVEGMKLCQKLERKDAADWPKFWATVAIEAATSDNANAIAETLRSREFRRAFATAAQEQLDFRVSEVRVVQELPQDIELQGGLGEDLFVIAVPEGRIADLGLCEGWDFGGGIQHAVGELWRKTW